MHTLRSAALVFALVVALVATVGPAPSVNQSIIALRNESGDIFCSGFVINKAKRYVMTAEHCLKVQEQPIMEGKRGWAVYQISPLDVAILQADAVWNVPALKPREDLTQPDEKVSAYGYADGRDMVRRIDGKIQFPMFFVQPDGPPYLLYVPDVIPGMSGGPILDVRNRVVGMNMSTRRDPNSSMSHPMAVIYLMTKEYWEPQSNNP